MTKAEVQQLVANKASQYGVPAQIALGIAAHESGFNDQAVNRANPNGTVDWGVMQLNDTTVQTMGVSNPLDAEQNVDAGVRLIASLLNRYGGDPRQALWAYASGPGNVGPNKTPNAIAQNFINYVLAYSGGVPAVTGSASPAVNPLLSEMPDYSASDDTGLVLWDSGMLPSGSDINWGAVALVGLGALVLYLVLSRN